MVIGCRTQHCHWLLLYPLLFTTLFFPRCSPLPCMFPQGFAQLCQFLHPPQPWQGSPLLHSHKVQVDPPGSGTCNFLTAHQLVFTAEVCFFLSPRLFHQVCVSVYIVPGSPFYSLPTDKVPDLVTLLEYMFSHSHMPSSSSTTDEVWSPSPPPLPHQSGLCLDMFLFIVSSFSYCLLRCQKISLTKYLWRTWHPPCTNPYRASHSYSGLVLSLVHDIPRRIMEWPSSLSPSHSMRPWVCLQASHIENLQARTASLPCAPEAVSCLALSQSWGWFQACGIKKI